MSFTTPGVFIEEIPAGHTIEGVPTSTTAFVGAAGGGPLNVPVRVTSVVDFERTFGTRPGPLPQLVADFFANGGRRAAVVRVGSADGPVAAADFVSAAHRRAGTGLYAVERGDRFGLLVVAPYAGGDVEPRVLTAAHALAERRGALLLVDAPTRWTTVADATAGRRAGLGRVSSAAVLFPRAGGRGTAGAVAGLLAKNDVDRGLGTAFGSRRLTGLPPLDHQLTQAEAADLRQAGISPVRDAGHGPELVSELVLVGSRESARPRRVIDFLHQSLDAGLAWTVFEPNGSALWAQVQREVEDFLTSQWRQGLLQGTSPQEAFFVRCGPATMTQADLDEGRLVVEVGFAPLRPAEFVVVSLRQIVGVPSTYAGFPFRLTWLGRAVAGAQTASGLTTSQPGTVELASGAIDDAGFAAWARSGDKTPQLVLELRDADGSVASTWRLGPVRASGLQAPGGPVPLAFERLTLTPA